MSRIFLTLCALFFLAGQAFADTQTSVAQYQVLEAESGAEVDSLSAEPVDAEVAAELEPDAEAEGEAVAPLLSVDPEYRFSVIKSSGGAFSVRGNVPSSAARTSLRAALGVGVSLTELEINSSAPPEFTESLLAGLAALEHLDSGQLAFARGAWLLSGYTSIDTHKTAAHEVIARLSDAENWQVMITAPKAITVCREAVEDYMDGKAILFASGSARLTSDSQALLQELAKLFEICPHSMIYIEGHTDSDGGDAANLVLSVARAEAVADSLVALGLAPDRLYAVGYGASLPVASNATNEGKRQNRRIVFSFEDAAD